MSNPWKIALLGTLVGGLLACSGGGSPPAPPPPSPATTLAYTDPTDASKWRLVRNPASTPTHLVLDLLAPSGATGRGAAVGLDADAGKATWSKVDAADPVLVRNRVYSGELLQLAGAKGGSLHALVCQEGLGNAKAYGSTALLSVALDLVPGTAQGTVSLVQSAAAHLPDGANSADIIVLIGGLRAQ